MQHIRTQHKKPKYYNVLEWESRDSLCILWMENFNFAKLFPSFLTQNYAKFLSFA